MTMSNEEIVRDYIQARNKNKQIKILAEAGVAGVKMPERVVKRTAEAEGPNGTL